MPASTEELIAINCLLIEREAEFARVHTLESEISALLGATYPFSPPTVVLPSTIKKKASTGKVKVQLEKQADPPIKIRRLVANEAAYRLTWLDKGQIVTNEVIDLRAVDGLIQDSLPALKLVQVETLDLAAKSIAVLFQATAQ
jgi:hypothetical protein